MKKQFLKYPFTTAGVVLWQAWLAGLSPVQHNEEAVCVERGLYAYVPSRFDLAPEQVAFLDSLPPMLCALWATQIAYAIREQIPITLTKPENKGDAQVLGVKFIESEASSGSNPSQPFAGEEEDDGYFLHFTIGY
ncbi:hypothetical protein [Parapedobacter tibetensis]|uniref:hypothetical protein n=1 Tax=Parapedobacter tibetensis TaxID=2972951 RepID=UPI00214D4C34|nr:hypothetical protein [Parapedobacter tibetensis]